MFLCYILWQRSLLSNILSPMLQQLHYLITPIRSHTPKKVFTWDYNSIRMNYQTLKVEYRTESKYVNMDVVKSMEDLEAEMRKCFLRLPIFRFDVYLKGEDDLKMTQELLDSIKETRLNDFELIIKEAPRDPEFELLSSEMDKIEIMDESFKNEGFEKYQEKLLQKQQENEPLISQKPLRREQPISQDKLELQKNNSNEILNEDIQCNGCFAFPIRGVIYKCLVCQDYDLCSKCQQTKHSFHPLLKVANKNQYPRKVKVVFSNKSKKTMEKLAQIDKIQEEKMKKAKYHPQVKDYRIVDPNSLKSKDVVAKCFLSEMIQSSYC